jgi:alkylresorcinol/alkylpyrone synthase
MPIGVAPASGSTRAGGRAVTDRIPRILALATAVPRFPLAQAEVATRAERLFPGMKPDLLARLMPVYDNAGIATRYSCVPGDWYERPHGWAEKNALYLEHAVDLLDGAARRALGRAGLGVWQIDAVVAVSTTGIATPSLDALLMERLGLRRDAARLPIFGLGCAGGVMGLSRAGALAGRGTALLLVVELCALTFRRSDQSKSNVVASALFGDGAAAVVIGAGGSGPEIVATGEHTWPASLDIMGWSVEDDGLGVVFSRDIPSLTRTDFRRAAETFLAAHGLALSDIDAFVCHPGGAKVLDALEDAFALPAGGLAEARSVLRDFGNMSAVTVFFVLERMLAAGKSGRMLLSALGPGFTAAFALVHAR